MWEPRIIERIHVAKTSQATFYTLWLFIILVSVWDGFLSLRYRYTLPALELNPIAQILIAVNAGRVWYLLALKFLGTVLAGAILLAIYQSRPKLGLIVCIAIAVLQLGLILFLYWGHIAIAYPSPFWMRLPAEGQNPKAIMPSTRESRW